MHSSELRPSLVGQRRRWLTLALVLVSVCAASLGTLGGCKRGQDAPPSVATRPTLRIYALGGPAGAIEPCGCVKDMLGGVDHVAGHLAAQKEKAPSSLLVAAGPLFFAGRAVLSPDPTQDLLKAETLALSLRDTGLVAWAPAANDWALGVAKFSELKKATGAHALAANVTGSGDLEATWVVDKGGLKVGLVGISLPAFLGAPAAGLVIGQAEQALREGQKKVLASGAQIVVALLAAPRGEALRLIERVTGFQLAIVGKPFDEGENNDTPFPPELVGTSLVVQAPNHLQGLGVVDLFVRDGGTAFADGTGVTAQAERESLEQQRTDLQRRLARAQAQTPPPRETSALAEALARVERKLGEVQHPQIPAQGSYFLYGFTEVREGLGSDARVAARLEAYYQRVNDHNKDAFADKVPVAAAAGQASYVGIDKCSTCHQEERKFWDSTQHAGAYATLSTAHKEFNLDCVSCHVTGYEQPGGSTVTHVEGLRDVQCEVCHGPGSQHVANAGDKAFIRPRPPADLCSSACHHPPHVNADWNAGVAWSKIVGPGHGR